MSVALMSHRGALDPGRWSPKELSTLSLWLDADDASTITIVSGSSRVSQWNDKSGNDYHVTQSTATSQPTWSRSTSTRRAFVSFISTTSQVLIGSDALDIRTGGFSYAAVAVQTGAPTMAKTAGALDADGEWSITRASFSFRLAGTTRTASLTASSVLSIWAGVLDRSTGAKHFRNSVEGTSVTAGFPDTTDYNTATSFGVGGRADATSTTDGQYQEIIVSLATWSDDDRKKVEGYLAHKHYQTALLPNDHPYKSVAP